MSESREQALSWRKLDVEIAEKVMGLEWLPWKPYIQCEGWYPKGWVSPRLEFGDSDADIRHECTDLPYYSTHIEAAWPIVERFVAEGNYKIEISAYPKDNLWTIKAFHVSGQSSKSCTTSAESLPYAICLAALKSFQVDAEKDA